MKRKFTRKRSTKRRRKSYSKPKNTAIKRMSLIPQKCVGLLAINRPALGGEVTQNFIFARYNYGGNYGPDPANQKTVIGVETTRRFNQTRLNYEQYIITGVKLEWIPANVPATVINTTTTNTGAVVSNLRPILFYEDIDTYQIEEFKEEQILVKDSWKLWTPNRRAKVYRNNKPLAKQQSSKWMESATTIVPAYTVNPDVP